MRYSLVSQRLMEPQNITESSVDFIPETIEEEYALLAGRLKAVEAYLDTSDSDYVDKNVLAAMLGI